jgi:PHP family Zn ribbon phosphoesterase
VIQAVLGATYPGVQKVWKVYNDLIARFGDEYKVLIDVPLDKLAEVVGINMAEAIVRVREERVHVIPGYDGVYGQIDILHEPKDEAKEEENIKEETPTTSSAKPSQKRLADFV